MRQQSFFMFFNMFSPCQVKLVWYSVIQIFMLYIEEGEVNSPYFRDHEAIMVIMKLVRKATSNDMQDYQK